MSAGAILRALDRFGEAYRRAHETSVADDWMEAALAGAQLTSEIKATAFTFGHLTEERIALELMTTEFDRHFGMSPADALTAARAVIALAQSTPTPDPEPHAVAIFERARAQPLPAPASTGGR